jgi:hypothetical protein
MAAKTPPRRDVPPALSLDHVTIERVPGGRTSTTVQAGDFLLSRAHGLRHTAIRFGQARRLAGEHRVYREYTHAALIISADGDLVEAVGAGVRHAKLTDYVDEPYTIVHIDASAEDRQQVVDVAVDILQRKARYSALSTVSIALWAFLGWRFTFFMDGSYTCSGLVARCLLAIGAIFNQDVVKVTPAQLAISFRAPVPAPRVSAARPAGGAQAVAPVVVPVVEPVAGSVAEPVAVGADGAGRKPVRPWRGVWPRRDRG